jgi:hypothetical protein
VHTNSGHHSVFADTVDVPGLYDLGSTYDVLNGEYASSISTKHPVMKWDEGM